LQDFLALRVLVRRCRRRPVFGTTKEPPDSGPCVGPAPGKSDALRPRAESRQHLRKK
jgi:hypothetical protein